MKNKYEIYKILQKRIKEIKESDRKSYFEIALEIGISESRLYTLMNGYSVSDDVVNKISDFVKSYLTKDEKLEANRTDNAELKAENARLKQEWRLDCLKCEYKNTKADVDKYRKTLQEIKKIAEKPKLFKDFSEIKTATEVRYDYAAICNELELRLHKVLELITKAESEG